MMLAVLAGLLLVGLTTLLHYEVLGGLSAWLPRLVIPVRSKLLVVMFGAFVAHVLEVLLYGVVLWALVNGAGVGGLNGPDGSTLGNCLYFSAETFSSLGFGDFVPVGPIRWLAGVEALNGLLLIGWSASYATLAMERFWGDARGPDPGREPPGA